MWKDYHNILKNYNWIKVSKYEETDCGDFNKKYAELKMHHQKEVNFLIEKSTNISLEESRFETIVINNIMVPVINNIVQIYILDKSDESIEKKYETLIRYHEEITTKIIYEIRNVVKKILKDQSLLNF